MKMSKKILSCLSATALVFTLASCDANRNTQTPTGSLNLNAVYAQNGAGQKVTYNEIYNQLRNKGYATMLDEIKHQLFAAETNKVNYATNAKIKEEIDEIILTSIYGTDDAEKFAAIKYEDIEKSVTKFVDNQFTSKGIIYTQDEIDKLLNVTSTKNAQGEYEFSTFNWPEKIVEQYKYSMAIVDYAKEYLNSICDLEEIKDIDGNYVENANYIDEEAIKSKYTAMQNYTTTADLFGITYANQPSGSEYKNHAIVVKFDSAAQARKYIEKVDAFDSTYSINDENITDAQALQFYIDLYNEMHKTEEVLTMDNLYTHKGVTFSINRDRNEYSDLGASVNTFMNEKLRDYLPANGTFAEDEPQTCYLSKPWDLAGDSAYYMMFRINVYEGKDWDDLDDATKTALTDGQSDLYNAVKEGLIEDWGNESFANTLVNNMFKDGNLDIKIYDPIYENQFANSYDDYKFDKKFDNKYVFKFEYKYSNDFQIESYRGKTVSGEWTVDEAFKVLNETYGVTIAQDILANKYLLSLDTLVSEVDEEIVQGYEDAVKETIKKFLKNKQAYSKKMGLENYLVLTYGYDNVEDVVNVRFLASDVKTAFYNYLGEFADENGKFKDTGLFENFTKFTDKNYDSFYSLDIIHLLVSIDMNNDGTFEDPKDLKEKLSAVDYELFTKDVTIIADCLALESELITADKIDAFKFLADSFENEGKVYELVNTKYSPANARITWTEFKQQYLHFDFEITAENLNNINNASGKNYVEEFTEEVINLYETLSLPENAEIVENIEEEGYWKYAEGVDTTKAPEEVLTATNYGYHMLYVTDYEEVQSAKFSQDSDYVEGTLDDGTNDYKYGDCKVLVYSNTPDTDTDDEYVYVDAYSDKLENSEDYSHKPSAQQLFIYFFEKQNKGTITNLPSKVETAISEYFADVITRYNSTNFQSYRLYTQMGGVTFTDANFNDRYAMNISILKRNINNYENLTVEDTFYEWFNLDWTVSF